MLSDNLSWQGRFSCLTDFLSIVALWCRIFRRNFSMTPSTSIHPSQQPQVPTKSRQHTASESACAQHTLVCTLGSLAASPQKDVSNSPEQLQRGLQFALGHLSICQVCCYKKHGNARHADFWVCLRRYNNQLLQLTISCLYLAAIVGALGSELARPLGRKVGVSQHCHLTRLFDPVPHPAEPWIEALHTPANHMPCLY